MGKRNNARELGPDERWRFSVIREDGSANQHEPAFHVDARHQLASPLEDLVSYFGGGGIAEE
jgi:hypothetical protein